MDNKFLWQQQLPLDDNLKKIADQLKKDTIFPPMLAHAKMPTDKEWAGRRQALCKMIDETLKTNIGRQALSMIPAPVKIVSYDWDENYIKPDEATKAYALTDQLIINIMPKTLSDPMGEQVSTLVHETFHMVHHLMDGIMVRQAVENGVHPYLNAYDLFFRNFLDESAAHINGQVATIQYDHIHSGVIALDTLFLNPEYWQLGCAEILKNLDKSPCPHQELNTVHTPAYYFVQNGYFALHPEICNPMIRYYTHKGFKLFSNILMKQETRTNPTMTAHHDWYAKYNALVDPVAEVAVSRCLVDNYSASYRALARKLAASRERS